MHIVSFFKPKVVLARAKSPTHDECKCLNRIRQVLTSPALGDDVLSAKQFVILECSDVSWRVLDAGFQVLEEAWQRVQRRQASPSPQLAASVKVLSHRLAIHWASRCQVFQEQWRLLLTPSWLKPWEESIFAKESARISLRDMNEEPCFGLVAGNFLVSKRVGGCTLQLFFLFLLLFWLKHVTEVWQCLGRALATIVNAPRHGC